MKFEALKNKTPYLTQKCIILTTWQQSRISQKFIPAYKNRSSILLWNVTAVCHESGWMESEGKSFISTRLRYSQTMIMYAQSSYSLRQKRQPLA